MHNEIKKLLNEGVSTRLFPGASVAVVSGKETSFIHTGFLTYDSDTPIDQHTLYDVASVTKSIPVGTLLAKAIANDVISLDQKASDYIPELQATDKKDITIRHLATYTAVWDLPKGLSAFASDGADAVLSAIYDYPLKTKPGKSYLYTNTPAILIGFILERVYKMTLPELAQIHIFSPLDMKETSFNPLEDLKNLQIAPSEKNTDGTDITGNVHDESSRKLREAGIYAGSAGLFSTAHDIALFCKHYISHKHSIFSESMYELIETNATPHLPITVAIGWELNQSRFMGEHCGQHTIGKTGFTGCTVVIDRSREKAFALMTNAQHPQRMKSREPLDAFRARLSNIIFK